VIDTSKTDDAPRLGRKMSGGYWDNVAEAWRRAGRQRLWREFSDRHQAALVTRWIGSLSEGERSPSQPAPSLSLVKTDLFDEVAGRGIVHRLLASGIRVTGIDISPVIIAEAAAGNPGLEAVVADVRSLPFADASFDVVFSGSTLDHFESAADIQAALCELGRVLRPRGTLILTLDNPANPLIWLRNGPLLGLFRRIGIVPYQVGATLGPRALERAVQAAGLDVVETTAVMHCPRAIAVAVAGPMERLSRAWQESFLRHLQTWERLERWPTRWLTGHYVAIHAVAPRDRGVKPLFR
jgi:SAM-dependent methyltransferase